MMLKQLLAALLLLCVPRMRARSMSLRADAVDNGVSVTSVTKRHEAWVRISEPPDAQPRHPAGGRFELECEAVGSPPPTIQWLRDGQPLLAEDGVLGEPTNHVADDGSAIWSHALAKQRARLLVHADHVTTYTCVASSGPHVAIASAQVRVATVAPPPHSIADLLLLAHSRHLADASTDAARIVAYDTIYMDNIGEDVILPCAAVGNPAPDVFWLDPSEQAIEEDTRHQVLPDGGLRISSIRWNDMGPYTCVARNPLGQDNITTFLYPMLAEK